MLKRGEFYGRGFRGGVWGPVSVLPGVGPECYSFVCCFLGKLSFDLPTPIVYPEFCGNFYRGINGFTFCSPWTFRANHSPNIIYTTCEQEKPAHCHGSLLLRLGAHQIQKTEPETHTKSAHTVLWPSGRQLWIGTTRSAGVGVWVSVSDMGRVGWGWPRGKKKTI